MCVVCGCVLFDGDVFGGEWMICWVYVGGVVWDAGDVREAANRVRGVRVRVVGGGVGGEWMSDWSGDGFGVFMVILCVVGWFGVEGNVCGDGDRDRVRGVVVGVGGATRGIVGGDVLVEGVGLCVGVY